MCGEINRRRGVKRRDQFPLVASQSKKHRQSECQFTPIYEEEVESRLLMDQSVTPSCTRLHNDDVFITDVEEPLPSSDFSGDRARGLVMFQPPDLLIRSPSSPMMEIKVHPDLIDAMREYQYQITSAYNPVAKDQAPNDPSGVSNLAVIPWVDPNINEQTKRSWEPIEADSDSKMMDTDECEGTFNNNEGLQQPPQRQHCLPPPPQVSPSIASPIRWW